MKFTPTKFMLLLMSMMIVYGLETTGKIGAIRASRYLSRGGGLITIADATGDGWWLNDITPYHKIYNPL